MSEHSTVAFEATFLLRRRATHRYPTSCARVLQHYKFSAVRPGNLRRIIAGHKKIWPFGATGRGEGDRGGRGEKTSGAKLRAYGCWVCEYVIAGIPRAKSRSILVLSLLPRSFSRVRCCRDGRRGDRELAQNRNCFGEEDFFAPDSCCYRRDRLWRSRDLPHEIPGEVPSHTSITMCPVAIYILSRVIRIRNLVERCLSTAGPFGRRGAYHMGPVDIASDIYRL